MNGSPDRLYRSPALIALNDPDSVRQQLIDWLLIFSRAAPSVVITDFAPGALLAARDRFPSISVGTGYTVPPAAAYKEIELKFGQEEVRRQATICGNTNSVLATLGASAIDSFWDTLVGDRSFVLSVPLLDPFRKFRRDPVIGVKGPLPEQVGSRGARMLAYFQPGRDRNRLQKIASALKLAGVATDVLLPGAHDKELAWFKADHLTVFDQYVPMVPLLRSCRLVLHAGSHGTAVAALFSGLPQILLPYDVEKHPTAEAISGTGAGISMLFKRSTAEEIAAAIRDAWEDHVMADAARRLAEEHESWRYRDPLLDIVRSANELAS